MGALPPMYGGPGNVVTILELVYSRVLRRESMLSPYYLNEQNKIRSRNTLNHLMY